MNSGYSWNPASGPPPWASQLWGDTSQEYAKGTSGVVNVVQTPNKLWDPKTIWHTAEKPLLLDLLDQGKISEIKVNVVDLNAGTHELSQNYINQLLKFDQRP